MEPAQLAAPADDRPTKKPKPAACHLERLSPETNTLIATYVLDYSRFTKALQFSHGTMVRSCKVLRDASYGAMDAYGRACTAGRWTHIPRSIMASIFTDTIRTGMEGPTKTCVSTLLLPPAVLNSLSHRTHSYARGRVAYEYSIPNVLVALSSAYPSPGAWEAAVAAKQQAALARDANRAKRETRKAILTSILTALCLPPTTRLDERLERLYVTNGTAKHVVTLRALAEAEAVRHGRRKEVDTYMGQRGMQLVVLPAATDYVQQGGPDAWAALVVAADRAADRPLRRERLKGVFAILPPRISAMQRYGHDDDTWEALLPVLQRVVELRARIKSIAPWAVCVPMAYWARRHGVREYLLHGQGPCDVDPNDLDELRNNPIDTMKKNRRAELVAALEARGMYLRGDSQFCKHFIDGTTEAAIDEVVATMDLTGYLFDIGGGRRWSRSHRTCEDDMRQSIRTGIHETWWEAAQHARRCVAWDEEDDGYDSDDW